MGKRLVVKATFISSTYLPLDISPKYLTSHLRVESDSVATTIERRILWFDQIFSPEYSNTRL